MSYHTPKFPTSLWTWSWHAAEIQAILGGYKQGNFAHSNLTEKDIVFLNKGKELVDYLLKKPETIKINPSEDKMIDIETLLSLPPFSTMQTPSELQKKLLEYREILQNTIEKKTLDNKKLNETHLFFSVIANKGDREYARFVYSSY